MRRGTRQSIYFSSGMSLVEMLAACLVISLVGAGIAGLLMLNGMTTIKMGNKVDNLNAARTAIERIARDVRMSRNFGDIYGQVFQINPGVTPAVYDFKGSNDFPSQTNSQNPLYPTYFSPPSGYPWGGYPYTLSNSTLIVQIPIFDANGFPTALAAGFGNPPLPANEDNLDTIVYNVIADPSNPGTYMLQEAIFPGWTNPPYSSSPYPNNQQPALIYNSPQTLLTGIIGPLDPATQLPVCFQYLDKTQPNAAPLNGGTPANGILPAGSDNANLTGVIVEFQVLTASSGQTAQVVTGVKTEVYARNNNVQTVTATNDQISGS